MARKKKFPYLRALIIALLIGTASWALYSVINMGAGDILLKYGVENPYYQSLIVIGVILVIIIILEASIKKFVDKIVKG